MSRFSPFTVGLLVLIAASPAFAQSRNSGRSGSTSGFGSSGGSGFGSGSGSTGDVSAGFGQNSVSGFGDTSSFGQSSGLNALSSGLGGSAAGMGLSLGSNSQGGSMGSASSRRSGTNSGNRSTSSRSGITGMTGQRSPGRTGGFGMSGMTGIPGMNSFNNMGRNNRLGATRGVGVQQAIRPVIQFVMDVPPPALAPTAVAQSINVSLAQNERIAPSLQGVQVNVGPAGIATVRGTATTEHQRTLAAAMLSLEPGVRTVRNEIVVNPAVVPTATPTLPPPATPSLQNSR